MQRCLLLFGTSEAKAVYGTKLPMYLAPIIGTSRCVLRQVLCMIVPLMGGLFSLDPTYISNSITLPHVSYLSQTIESNALNPEQNKF